MRLIFNNGHMEKNSNQLGALWSHKPKSEKGPVFTGEINGERVAVFENKKWSDKEGNKQPKYHVLKSTMQKK